MDKKNQYRFGIGPLPAGLRAIWGIVLALIVALPSTPSLAQTTAPAGKQPPFETFQDWRLQCDAGKKRCFIFQNTNLEKTGQQILAVVVGNLGPEGKHILHLTVPLGIYLPPGVAIRIDEGKQIDIPVLTCTPKGCEAVLNMEVPLWSALEKGKAANVAFLDAVTRRQITVAVSLSGFTDAYTALRRALSLQ